MPKVSIITPIYCDIEKKIDWLDEQIKSVISQSLVDWEMILINDKSPVSISEVKAKYITESRLRWFDNAKNYGPAMTRNTAVALAASDCILPLDADDMLAAPETLEDMYDAWLMDKTKVIYGNLQLYTPIANSGQFRRGKVVQLGDYTFELTMNLNGLMPVTVMHSKECHLATGGWKSELSYGLEDVEYWISAGERGYCGHKLKSTTLVYRRQEESRAYKLKHVNRQFEAMQNMIKQMHSDIYQGRFPMACCGKGATTQPTDPIIMSEQDMRVNRVVPLEGFKEEELEWVLYNGPRKGSFDILARGSSNLPNKYSVFGTGQIFQIHKKHRQLFVNRQRLGFMMNQQDPRTESESNPEPKPEPEPLIVEVPKPPEMSVIERIDSVASRLVDIEIQEVSQEVSVTPGNLTSLGLSARLTETLTSQDYTLEKIATLEAESLVFLPGIGKKKAENIIGKAKELIRST